MPEPTQAKTRRKARRQKHGLFIKRGKNRVDLLLAEDIAKLGHVGDVVNVTAGYARNYLLPQGLAVPATDHHVRLLEKKRQKMELERAAQLEDLKTLAEQLAKTSCTITAKTNEEGHLYGSVGPNDIAAQLANENIQIDPVWVQLEEPIREKGVFEIELRLADDISAIIRLWVVEE